MAEPADGADGANSNDADNQTLLKFPTAFPIKATGRPEDAIVEVVLEIVRRHAPDFDPATLTTRPSTSGKYLAVTATINAHSKAQLDNIYRALTAHPAVLVAL